MEHARERAEFERRKATLLHQQASARSSFEQQVTEKSSLQHAFDLQRSYSEGNREGQGRQQQDRGGPELEL